jgi:hypothetical protein
MKKHILFLQILLFLTFLSFSFVDLDPGYINAFGWGSVCVSVNGFPEKDKYSASQYEFKDSKFYVKKGGRIDVRAILPQGITYGVLLRDFKNQNSAKYTDVISEAHYFLFYPDHMIGGIQVQWGWPSDPGGIISSGNPYTLPFGLEGGVLDWNTSGAKWDDMENGLQTTVGTWLEYAEPGWQMYVAETVGWERWRPEDKYWDWDKGQYVTPSGYEFARPHAYCILEVK